MENGLIKVKPIMRLGKYEIFYGEDYQFKINIMNDNGNPGLNRGNSMKIKKPLPEGVVYSDLAKKWLVRVKNKQGIVISVAGYGTEKEAQDHLDKLNQTEL